MGPRSAPPDALLLIGTRCPHCQSVLDSLTLLIKEGSLSRLTVVNVTASPEAPEARGLRSVPRTRIGPFELSGALPPAELREWVEAASAGGGWGRYLAHLIESGRLEVVVERIQKNPETLTDLLHLFADPDTPLSVRIGVSATIETLAGSAPLRQAVPQILALTLADQPQVRADACHFLGLAGDPGASAAVQRLLDDTDPEVREVAAETLALLGEPPATPAAETDP